jgi:hypothetical protein
MMLPTLVVLLWLTGGALAQDVQKAPNFPADYKGTPYKGVAQEIPGRVDFENFDEGGYKVGFQTQHREASASGKDYRPAPTPQICVTNNPIGPDKMIETKARYPEKGESYFIGWAKKDDWVKCTVNVKKAGVYKVSTTASCEKGRKMVFDVSFNDIKKIDVTLEGTGDYHIWKTYKDFATVKLDAGLQVLKFHLSVEHMNYDFLEFEFDEKATAESK